MPGKIDGAGSVLKRKRVTTGHKPSKRSRSVSSDEDIESRILLLENQIFESKKNYNNISTLIKHLHADSNERDVSLVASVALCRVFTRLITSGGLVKKAGITDKELVVILWLQERYSEYKNVLLKFLGRKDVASTVLTLCMRMLKTEGSQVRDGVEYSFPTGLLKDIVRGLLRSDTEDSLRREFSEKYLEEYDDLRFYTFTAVETILAENEPNNNETEVDYAINILSAIDSVPESKEELEDFYIPAPPKKSNALYSLASHKKHAQATWLAIMRTEMSSERRKKILGHMTSSIIPWFIKPELLMDFLSDCYDTGGSTSLLALSGVFYLIQEKNLDYPSFYLKLYSLLDRRLLHSKHRSKLFRLLDTFLASTHLPAVLVASFIKRLSRLAISAPPAAIVAVVPWIYNLLKRHPACTFMIHREVRGPEAREILENEGMEDPFIADEADPMLTNAIESCLWEIVLLQSHYHPNVATLAKIISEQFTKQAYNLEDFLDHSYGSMLEAELSKELKKTPVVEYEIPKKILTEHGAGSAVEDSILVKLWDFS